MIGFCEHGDEPPCALKAGDFLTSCFSRMPVLRVVGG
jgi:hypothetical protein